ncbi:MAG TPA: valine--tRNA ligase, partial [Dehalococcoidia bacterium]|nr:valine--tRNA ligase [Dehalococcoidia bacterium]
GRTALVPGVQRPVPIIADEAVDPKFGTGALKITPGHDQLDFEIGERHGLSAIVAIALDGTMTEAAGPYQGMDRSQCEEAILRDLESQGLLEKVEKHRHAVGHCQRCGTVVEPLISKQWFVRTGPLAGPSIAAVKEGRIKIVPRRFTRVYLHWMENIRDWCISRQLWWGHRIPVWYCQSCSAQVAPQRDDPLRDPESCPACGARDLRQDEDVLDTWFSSGLWPHSTLGWPENTQDLRYFYPTAVMETGYDILFFWVARMIMLGLYNTGEVPFRYVYLHGLVRDQYGRKMSKSEGNVVDPLEAIEAYGCDALRFALATGAAPGNDSRISDERLEGGRNFANKIWNASRFVISNLAEVGAPVLPPDVRKRAQLPLEDRWIMSRLQRTTGEVDRLLNSFQLGEAGKRLHEFFWSEYCDWYLEMAKVRLRSGEGSSLSVLAWVLDASLRLLHPFMPFVTEAVWQNLRPYLAWAAGDALIVASWPKAERRWLDAEAETNATTMMEVIRAIRNIRAEKEVEASRWVESYVAADGDGIALSNASAVIEALARTRPLHIVPSDRELPKQGVAIAILSGAQVALPLAGLMDVGAERERLRKQLAEAEDEERRASAKLANQQFRSKAPAEVVAREEERLAAVQSRLAGLRQRLAELG